MQTLSPEPAEQHWGRGDRHVPPFHQSRHRLALRDGHRGEAATAEHQARPDVDVKNFAKHCQPRRVFQGAAHGLLQ